MGQKTKLQTNSKFKIDKNKFEPLDSQKTTDIDQVNEKVHTATKKMLLQKERTNTLNLNLSIKGKPKKFRNIKC